jgi:hypothetical protein
LDAISEPVSGDDLALLWAIIANLQSLADAILDQALAALAGQLAPSASPFIDSFLSLVGLATAIAAPSDVSFKEDNLQVTVFIDQPDTVLVYNLPPEEQATCFGSACNEVVPSDFTGASSPTL